MNFANNAAIGNSHEAAAQHSLPSLLALLRSEGFAPKVFGEAPHPSQGRPPDLYLRGAVVDSREAAPDLLFVARKGEKQDGHDYIEAARKRGAQIFLVSETWALQNACKIPDAEEQNAQNSNPQRPCLIAIPESQGSTEAALFALARAYRRRLQSLFVVAISGSYGKTGTKELLGLMLCGRYRCHTTAGNRNAPVGCALTILGIPKESEVAVLELGIDHPGEMDLLCSLAQPNAALLTGIGWAHIGAFGSRSELARQKARIYAQLQPWKGGVSQNDADAEAPKSGIPSGVALAFLPAADAFLPVLQKAVPQNTQSPNGQNGKCCKEILYSAALAEQKGFRVEDLGLEGLRFCAPNLSRRAVTLPLLGRHNQQMFWAAAAIAQALGVSTEQIFRAAQQYRPLFGRGELLRRHFICGQTGQTLPMRLLQDCYNASPESVYAVLNMLGGWQKQGLLPFCILVLGDMRELGSVGAALHRRALALLENLLSPKPDKKSSGGSNIVALLHGPNFHRAYREHRAKKQSPESNRELSEPRQEIWQKRCALPQNEDELLRAVEAGLQSWASALQSGAPPPLLVLKGARAMRLEKIAEKILL